MKNISRLMIIGAFALLIAVPATFAQTPEVSTLPIDEPTDVGGTILQPGVYMIRVLPRLGTRNQVQITSPDRQTIYATVLTVPHQLEPNEEIGNTTFVYFPAGEGAPRALRTWFAPDPVTKSGHDIVYEESRAKQLARLANEPVVAYRGPVTEITELEVVAPDATVETYTVPAPDTTAVVTPAPAPETTVVETTTPAPLTEPMISSAQEQPAMEMPRTASKLPLLALLSVLSLVAAAGLRFASRA